MLHQNVSGDSNTAVGYQGLYNITTSYSTAVGSFAPYNNTSGRNNTATGYFALYPNNVDYNTANGSSAL